MEQALNIFNLYYGALRHTPYKWLDLNALCEKMFPKNVINRIHCFTARVTDPLGILTSLPGRMLT